MSKIAKENDAYPIDIVVLWVDGNDPEWLHEKNTVLGIDINKPAEYDIRYRDWGLMRYWFRGIEKFAPWVNNIHFVTWGHLPKWLNINHPNLNIVRHSDYMPKEALPTYNSNSLLINIHRIPNLSEHFIVFNDDMLLIKHSDPKIFFKNGLPRYKAIHCPYRIDSIDPFFPPLNDCAIVNKYFSMKESVLKNIFKWINLSNGINALSTVFMLPFPAFYGFIDDHLPSPYLKSTFELLWRNEKRILQSTTINKVRSSTDVNEWLFKYCQIASGKFYPQKRNLGKAFFPARFPNTELFIKDVNSYITNQKGFMICINDGNIPNIKIEIVQKSINNALKTILPQRSSFEID